MAKPAVHEPAHPPADPQQLAADDDGLVEQTRARVARSLGTRDFMATVASGTCFLAVTAALVAWLPLERPAAGYAVAVLLVLCYAVAARVQFEVGFAFAVPTQLIFVPMLFLLPLP